MGLFSNFFKSGDDPVSTWIDEILGPTSWDDNDEAWHGNFKDYDFAVSYERKQEPLPEVVGYARAILTDPGWIGKVLEDEKGRARRKYSDDLWGEIENLRISEIWFGLQRGKLVAVVQLAGGCANERAWRMDFAGRKCSGIGFDS